MSDSPFRLEVSGLKQPLAVTGFHGTEAISQPYVFTLQVVCEPAQVAPAQLMYRSAFLAVDEQDTGFHGQIQGVERQPHPGSETRYRLVLGPRLACLAQRCNVRVFQGLSARQIIAQVLSEHGLRGEAHAFHLKVPCRPRAFCAQYQENDLQFVQRLCAEEGIHYHFAHSRQGHRLIFASGLYGARRSPPAPWHATTEGPAVTRFAMVPNQDPQAGRRAEGDSTLSFINSGRLFAMSGHACEAWNGLWRVLHVEHAGQQRYGNRFVVQPWDARVPIAAPPAQALPVVMRAWVMGAAGEPADRDANGRVRVQFDWVMQGAGARFADCWLPVQRQVRSPLLGGMPVLASPSRQADQPPQIIACLSKASLPAEPPQEGQEPLQACVSAAWLMGERRTLQLRDGPLIELHEGAELTLEVGASRVRLDAQGLALSAAALNFTHSVGEPAIAALQAPGDATQGQGAQQHEEQEGQP